MKAGVHMRTKQEPIKPGTKCRMKDGSEVYIILVHRPGNGYAVSVSPQSPREYHNDRRNYEGDTKKNPNRLRYYAWYVFRKMVAEVGA